jgi:hypothetical protein
MTFRLTMLPALDGDCLLLSWGANPDQHHMLVDLGRGATYKTVRPMLAALGTVELFVVTHIDADHIAGAMPLVGESVAPFKPHGVWYNGRPQLVAALHREPIHEPFGARQGEKLSRGIIHFGWPRNREFASEIVSINSPEADKPVNLAGGLSLRLVSPRDQELKELLPTWDKELERAHLRLTDPDSEEPVPLAGHFEPLGRAPEVSELARARYQPDTTKANGSSIALIAEYEGKRLLLAGDAHSEVLEEGLANLGKSENNGRYRIDLFKVSHHGSRANTSPALCKLIDCTRFAISTDGSREHKHPHPETIARFLAADPDRMKTFYFNYRQPQTEIWEADRLAAKWKYECVFPASTANDTGNGLIRVDV